MAVFNNFATLSYNGKKVVSNITEGEIVEPVAVYKDAVTDTYTAGSTVTYIVRIVNNGDTALSGLTLTDNLGSYSFGDPAKQLVPLTYVADSVNYYVNCTPQAATVSETNPLTLTGINVPANGTAMVIYSAKANEFAPVCGTGSVINTVSVTGSPIVDPVTASTTITADTSPQLTVSKELSPLEVAPDGELTYTFIISNSGTDAITDAGDLVLNDIFDPALNITSVTFNGTPWAETTNYTYVPATGTFNTVEGQLTVPAATCEQDETTGAWSVNPGTSTLVVTGTLA